MEYRLHKYISHIFTAAALMMFGLATAQIGGKKLSPADFKGVPDEASNFFAQTNPVISFAYYSAADCREKGKVMLKVETGISISKRSWLKLNRIKSSEVLEELLSHEQGHYDIGEVFAIDLKRTVSNMCFDRDSFKVEADSVFRAMNKRYDTLQLQYDAETDHMRNKEMQVRWKRKIAEMLKSISK